MAIDQRLVERRKQVAESKARRNLKRLLRLFVATAVIGAGVWLVLSPHLSVSEVRVAGVSLSETHRILVTEDVIAGTPMVFINPGSVESALEGDPWVANADVTKSWPDAVLVSVEERVAAAWVETSGGWVRRASDGVAVPSPRDPDTSLPWVQVTSIDDGEAEESQHVLGAIEFVTALPQYLGRDALVRTEGDGELWAQVAGYQVRLGRPVEMAQKAASLVALLATDPPLDGILVLVAPTHPAVAPSGQLPTSDKADVEPTSEQDVEGSSGQTGGDNPGTEG